MGVVSDEPLQKALDRLRGEWAELGGGAYETVVLDEATPEAFERAELDACVFASPDLGPLCESGSLRPIRSSTLRDERLNWEDIAPLVREREATYGGVVMALPLGSATPLLLGPPDAPGIELAGDDRELALTLLAWAAPHAVHPSTVATLFDDASMAPRLKSPPFERALDELASAAGQGAPDAGDRRTVVWPMRDVLLAGDALRYEVAPIPAATEAFNPLARQWEPAVGGATLVGSRGSLMAITSRSRNAAAASRLAAWLAGVENARTLAVAGVNVAVHRASLSGLSDDWLLEKRSVLGREFASQNLAALRADRWLLAPRIPGWREYLATLGSAVRKRIDGAAMSAEVLAEAAAAWERITDRLGRQRQRTAYLRSVGLAAYEAPTK